MKLEQELVECHKLEEKTIRDQEAAKDVSGNFYGCMPCAEPSTSSPINITKQKHI